MTALDDYRAHLENSLSELRQGGLFRQMHLPKGIDFVSNDYLGFRDHPYIVERMRESLATVGVGSGGSRLLRGHHKVFEDIEARLATFSGAEAALLLGSGYLANVGLIQALVSPNDRVLSDERNHASLIDGIRLSGAKKVIYPHNDLDAVEKALRSSHPTGRTFLITESLFSMDGDLTPLESLASLAEAFGALLIVDEAHATGLYGQRGAGLVEEQGLRNKILATIHTGGKALGSGGAWIAGPRTLRDLMINRGRTLIFSTAPLPVLAIALGAALDFLEKEPTRATEVHRKAATLRQALSRARVPIGKSSSPIIPIIVGDNERVIRLQEGLAVAGFDARAVRPPTVPAGTARLRVTVRYPLHEDDLQRFVGEVTRLCSLEAA